GGTAAPPATVSRDAADVVAMAEIAARAGIRTLRLTLLAGLPGETDRDREAARALVRHLHTIARRTPHGLRLAIDLRPVAAEPYGPWPFAAWPGRAALEASVRALAADVALRSVRLHAGSAGAAVREGL